METKPAWLQYNNQDGWSRFGNTLAEWRTQVKNRGDLEPRLLKIVLKELRRDLQTQNTRAYILYDRHYSWYWQEKEDAFVKTAQDVLAENENSSAIVLYAANYLYWSVNRPRLAIEALLDAHRREVLDEAGQSRLVEFLHGQDRFGESIGILEPLVERRPDNLRYRVLLMWDYFKTNRPRQLAKLLARPTPTSTRRTAGTKMPWPPWATVAWKAGFIRNRSLTCRKRFRTASGQVNRGIGDGTLSNYYVWLAQAYAGLKKTAEAVDAAAAAMVAWGRNINNRRNSIESLRQVLGQSPDLDAYVAQLDRQTQESGLDRPIIRKALGQVYLQRREHAKAIRQLNLALQSQPNDAQTYQALLDCYDPWATSRARSGNCSASAIWPGGTSSSTRTWATAIRRSASRARASGPLRRSSKSCRRNRRATGTWRRSASAEPLGRGRRPVATGGTDPLLEPTGLLGLAQALIHEHRGDEAAEALAKLKQTSWPARFGKVSDQVRLLEQQLRPERH